MLVKFFFRKPLQFLPTSLRFSFTSPPPPNNSTPPISPHPDITKVATQLQEDLKSKPLYLHKTNYNFEENKAYTKKVQAALINTVEQQKVAEQKKNSVGRRKRRVFDGPKHDFDITNYSAWRIYEQTIQKPDDHVFKVVCKIPVAPALMLKVFGRGKFHQRNKKATREWDFEDNDLSKFLVYDYDWRRHMKGDTKSKKNLTEEDFWKSEEPHMFRVNATRYADFRKFKKWVLDQIEKKKGEPSYEETFIQKYGDIETFEDYDKKHELNLEATVFKYDWSYYVEKNEQPEINPDYGWTYIPAKVMDEKYRLEKPMNVRYIRVKKQAKAAIKLDDSEDTVPDATKQDTSKDQKQQGKQEKKAKGDPQQQQTQQQKGKKQETIKTKTEEGGKTENAGEKGEKKEKAPKAPKAEKGQKGETVAEKDGENAQKGQKQEKPVKQKQEKGGPKGEKQEKVGQKGEQQSEKAGSEIKNEQVKQQKKKGKQQPEEKKETEKKPE